MKTLFDGFLKIKEFFREGKRYEVMDRGNSVTVLLVKPGLSFEGDQFYIGSQFRAGAKADLYTQVAGMIDKMPDGIGHEAPPEAAFREAMEEAGPWVVWSTCTLVTHPLVAAPSLPISL